jgi:hypothetical protein
MKRIWTLAIAGAAATQAATLSGTVELPSGVGLGGVSVGLRKTAALAATTNSAGSWTLTTTGILGRDHIGSGRISSDLYLENGRLELRYKGVGIDGRAPGSDGNGQPAPHSAFAARSLATAVDTLMFSLGGSVVARLPVGTLDSTGIITIIDTTTPAVDQGAIGNTWATGPAPATVCDTGTWIADGPDPGHNSANNSDGTGLFVLRAQSAHFAIYSDEALTSTLADSALNFLENSVWKTFFGPPINNPEPLCNSTTKYKISIHIHSTWGLSGGAWDNLHGGMWFASGALADHWGMPHEFTHAWQALSGGLSCGTGPNTCGWIYESHANWSAHQLPENQSNVHCSEMLDNMPHLYLGSTRDRYCNWQFMEYLKDKYGYQAVSGIWTGTPNADPFKKIMADQGWALSQLNDFLGDWAMHNVTWDYQVGGGAAFRSTYGNITIENFGERRLRLTQLEPLDSGWASDDRFVTPFYWAPQRFGYNVVRLYPTSGASTVTVTFRGVIQSGANTDFRWGLVATDAAFTTSRYSRLQRGTDGSLTFKVNTGEPLFLVVMGTPSVFESIVWDQDWNTMYRFPYMVQLTNAWPQGFQNGALAACPTGLARHANGGGCAPSGLASSVYVGPYATVLSGTTVTGSARIEDEAAVVNGTVSGGTVGAMTLVGDNDQPYDANPFTISGSPTVRTTFYPLGYFETPQSITGTANVYGDVEYRGANTDVSSGNFSGYVDGTGTSQTTTDETAKGPYTWRP